MKEFQSYISHIQKEFEACCDFCCRRGQHAGGNFTVMYIRSITLRDFIAESILRPLLRADLGTFKGDFGSIMECPSLIPPKSEREATEMIAKGEALVLIENKEGDCFYTLANAQFTIGRSVDEPDSDVTVRGPKGGFVESAERNLALLRQYVRTPKLKVKSFILGEISSTSVLMCYVEGRADEELVKRLAKQIEGLKATVITDSTNLSMLLSKNRFGIFPICGSSEKVDKVASKMVAGRIALIVDGSPFVLTLPFLFIEGLQASDDYLHTPYYATFIRLLRLFAFLSALFAPAILCAVINYDAEIMPPHFYGIIYDARKDIPLSFFWEIIAVLVLFEVLREVGVRMPRTVGDAVGIVGSIILGNTAVEAGIVSSVGVITVAFSAVCAFITPAYMYFIVLARIIILALSELFGIWGLVGSAIGIFIIIATQKSFGVHYLFPLIPFDKKGAQDTVFSNPKKTLGRREVLKK